MPRALLAIAVVLASLPLSALEPKTAGEQYARLQQWRFSAPVPIPEGGVTIARDSATWTLQSGSVRLMEPMADGTITGLYFEGQGRFRMAIPDRYEVAQLRRFAAKPELQGIDQPITKLVLRTSDASVAKLFPAPQGASFAPVQGASKRYDYWMEKLFRDPDAAIIASLLNRGSLTFVADAHTEDFDWLLYEYDSWRPEEITLSHAKNGFSETWISLDREADRRPDGRPGLPRDPVFLEHVDVTADLTKRGRTGLVGSHGQAAIDGSYVVKATFAGASESIGALRLELYPAARDLVVTDDAGTPLVVLRDPIGKRSIDIENKFHDDDLVVILPAPLERGAKQTLRFSYVWESGNYAPGGPWYPMVDEVIMQPHTARLELTVQKKNEARAMGRLEKRSESEGREVSVWVVERPTSMVTFSTALRFEEVRLTPAGIPPVIAFGPDFQIDNRDKVRNVGADVANSMQYFQGLLGDRLDVPEFYVTSIAAGHGQAFEGFLHMTEYTFEAEHPGASELFRAHEVAHEWFGHKIGWATYRDQWLSEALAEYTAMMFVQGFVKGEEKYFDEMLRSYDGIIRGLPLAGGFSKFNRPWLAATSIRAVDRDRVGPIGHGWRADTAEIPGYRVQSYFKGPMVLNMLRMILKTKTGNDDLFVKILRDYVRVAKGKRASTDDFRRVVEANVGGSWQDFFASWIYGADIPSYRWDYSVAPAEGGVALTIDLERRDTAADFMTIIPVRVEFDGNRAGHLFIVNRENRQSVTHKLPEKPRKVVFAPDFSVLGKVDREKVK